MKRSRVNCLLSRLSGLVWSENDWASKFGWLLSFLSNNWSLSVVDNTRFSLCFTNFLLLFFFWDVNNRMLRNVYWNFLKLIRILIVKQKLKCLSIYYYITLAVQNYRGDKVITNYRQLLFFSLLKPPVYYYFFSMPFFTYLLFFGYWVNRTLKP